MTARGITGRAAEVYPAEEGGFIAECPDVPGAMGQGETEREAIESLIAAIIAIELWDSGTDSPSDGSPPPA